MNQGLPRIWIITNPDHPEGPITPIRRALEACPRGLVGVQLRAKQASDRQLVDWGRTLRALTEAKGCAFVVNRRVDIAEIVGADGVHLPERGLSPLDIRGSWPSIRLLGASRHDSGGLTRADQEDASYATLSPVFAVPGKAPPIGIGGFHSAIAGVGIPTYALGGIEPANFGSLLDAGAFGIAIRRAIYDASEPAEALQRFLRVLDKLGFTGE